MGIRCLAGSRCTEPCPATAEYRLQLMERQIEDERFGLLSSIPEDSTCERNARFRPTCKRRKCAWLASCGSWKRRNFIVKRMHGKRFKSLPMSAADGFRFGVDVQTVNRPAKRSGRGRPNKEDVTLMGKVSARNNGSWCPMKRGGSGETSVKHLCPH